MKKKQIKLIAISVIVLLLIFSITVFGKDYLEKKNLYIPKDEFSTEEHSYMISQDQYGEDVTFFVPKSYDVEKKNKWILLAHGSNGSNMDLIERTEENSLLKPLLDEGYIIVVPNYRDVLNWGNQDGVEDLVASFELAQRKYNLEQQPILMLQSMGGLLGLTTVAKDLIEPKKIIGIYPVTNLRFEYENPHEAIPGFIEDAFNFSEKSEFEKATEGYDPVNDYGVEVFVDIPMLFIASNEDTIVPKKENTDDFARELQNNNGDIQVLDHQGEHGDISAFNSQEIIEFLNANK